MKKEVNVPREFSLYFWETTTTAPGPAIFSLSPKKYWESAGSWGDKKADFSLSLDGP